MTRLRRLAALLSIALAASACAHYLPGTLQASRLAVNGITIGSLRSAVVKRLGTPMAVKTGFDDVMSTGEWEELSYPGLVVHVIRPEPGVLRDPPNEPYVSSVVITDRSWRTVSGLRVGDSLAEVRRVLGAPERVETAEDPPYWYYATRGFDGRVVITFRDDVVIEIRIEEDWT